MHFWACFCACMVGVRGVEQLPTVTTAPPAEPPTTTNEVDPIPPPPALFPSSSLKKGLKACRGTGARGPELEKTLGVCGCGWVGVSGGECEGVVVSVGAGERVKVVVGE